MNNIRYGRVILALVILVISSLACNLFNRISPTPVEKAPIPITTESADNLREDLSTTAESLMVGEKVTLVIDEAEITSLVAIELEKQSDPIFYEPQIYLRDGEVQIKGNVLQSGFMVPAQMNLVLTTDSDGHPQINILSAKVGPLELPDSMLKEISGQIGSVFTDNISPRIKDIYVESILIADGLMTIIGHTR
ncbi:MAG: hypothetical protein KAS36_00755 [Anaerolineales bacterium]|nr:hypothetical protein [Anaerolineales bacterium]